MWTTKDEIQDAQLICGKIAHNTLSLSWTEVKLSRSNCPSEGSEIEYERRKTLFVLLDRWCYP